MRSTICRTVCRTSGFAAVRIVRHAGAGPEQAEQIVQARPAWRASTAVRRSGSAWPTAMTGGRFSTASTSGRSSFAIAARALGEAVARNRRCPSACTTSKASELFPLPLTPDRTVISPAGNLDRHVLQVVDPRPFDANRRTGVHQIAAPTGTDGRSAVRYPHVRRRPRSCRPVVQRLLERFVGGGPSRAGGVPVSLRDWTSRGWATGMLEPPFDLPGAADAAALRPIGRAHRSSRRSASAGRPRGWRWSCGSTGRAVGRRPPRRRSATATACTCGSTPVPPARRTGPGDTAGDSPCCHGSGGSKQAGRLRGADHESGRGDGR